MRIIKNLQDEINKLFNRSNIKELTNQSDFIKRFRKISAVSLLESVLFSGEDPSKVSLNDMSIYHMVNFGISVTRQGLAKKFNIQATMFLKLLLGQLLSSKLSQGFDGFTCSSFKRVIIKDSTCNQLPDHLKEFYPGSGGAGSNSAVRIQFEYDIKNLEVIDLNVTAFNHQDISYAKDTLDKIKQDDLVIRDLGYTCIDVLNRIEKQKAWYISRLNYSTTVRQEETMELLDFVQIEKQMKEDGIYILNKKVLIGKEKYPTRLIIELLPDKQKEERIRKASFRSKKKGRKLSKEKRARAGLNLFITNCSSSMLASTEIRRIYGIRWQIELIFKAWKQNSQFHKVKKMNVDRYEFLIYAKLIWVMLNWKMYQIMDIITFNKIRQRISILKFYKILNVMKSHVMRVFRGEKMALYELINTLEKTIKMNLLHEDRIDRINWRIVENI